MFLKNWFFTEQVVIQFDTGLYVGSKMFRVSMQLESFPYLVIRDKSLKPYNKDVFINPKTL